MQNSAYVVLAGVVCLGIADLFPRWLTHMAGKLILVLGASPCVLPRSCWASSLRGGWVAKMSIPRGRKWKLPVSEGLGLEIDSVTSTTFCGSPSHGIQIPGKGDIDPAS